MVGSGLKPRTPTVVSATLDTLTWPVRSRVLGIGSTESVAPNPVIRNT